MYRLIDYAAMLRDRRRVDAYARALQAAITPSSVVLDIGTGIGTFTLLACRFGAARVYAVESADIIKVAEQHVRMNGFNERVQFLHARASDIDLPERVDIILSDLGNALPLFDEHLTSIIDARDRFLKPGGTLIPRRDRLLCAPIGSEELYARITEPWRSVEGLDLRAGETMAMNAPQAQLVAPDDLAAEPRCWAELDYATITSPDAHGSAEWSFDSERVIHGIAVWFESTLHDGITYASGPWSEGSVHATLVLPLLRPRYVRAGETLRVKIDAVLESGRYVMTWSAGEEMPVAPHVLSRKVGPDLLLLDQSTGVYHVLNETGALVWESLQRGEPLDTIAHAVAAEFDVDPSRAAEDVAAIVGELQREHLIHDVTQ